MTAKAYVVRLGGKLYVASDIYTIYQSTTKDLLSAHLFKDLSDAQKIANKSKGEVVELTVSDGDYSDEINQLKAQLEKVTKEKDILEKAFKKIMKRED